MRTEGTLIKWDDARGFGFIKPYDGGEDVFVHITAFPVGTGRPSLGEEVSYELETGDKGPRANHVMSMRTVRTVAQLPEVELPGPSASRAELFLIPCFLIVMIVLSIQSVLAQMALFGYGVVSMWTFFLFAHDKASARKGRWRVEEAMLLLSSSLGGWPGALLAQHVVRHKTSKRSFRSMFWATVTINLIALGMLLCLESWLD